MLRTARFGVNDRIPQTELRRLRRVQYGASSSQQARRLSHGTRFDCGSLEILVPASAVREGRVRALDLLPANGYHFQQTW